MIRQFSFTWTAIGWLLMGYGLFFVLSPLQAQSAIKKFSLELKNESLPEALKQIEKAGGKNILFTYNGTESCINRQTFCLYRTGRVFRRTAQEIGQSHRRRRQSI